MPSYSPSWALWPCFSRYSICSEERRQHMRCVLVVEWTDAAAEHSRLSLEPRQLTAAAPTPEPACCVAYVWLSAAFKTKPMSLQHVLQPGSAQRHAAPKDPEAPCWCSMLAGPRPMLLVKHHRLQVYAINTAFKRSAGLTLRATLSCCRSIARLTMPSYHLVFSMAAQMTSLTGCNPQLHLSGQTLSVEMGSVRSPLSIHPMGLLGVEPIVGG